MARAIRCLITAGPTREYFDPVRFLSNPSTGKMGFALAEAAAEAGWAVTLVAGPVALPTPEGVERVDVETGAEMLEAVAARFEAADVFIATAAVMDYRPKARSEQKVKKEALSMTVEMEATADILKTMGERRRTDQLLVGFAAETENVVANARKKLVAKHCDFVAANQVGVSDRGFASDHNQITLVGADGSETVFGPATKREVARQMIARLRERA